MTDEVQVIQGTNEAAPEQVEQPEIDYQAELAKRDAKILKFENAMTRQSSELGELRKLKPLIDKILLDQAKPKEPVDFFTDPAKAVAQEIESSPSIQKFQQATEGLRQKQMLLQLKESHPDYQEVAKDAEFRDWVEASKVRTRLFQEADQSYDFDAANELLSNWKERKVLANTAKVEEEIKQKTEEDLKAAKVHTGSGVSGKKIYTKRQLATLLLTDRDAYQAMNIQQLYAQGRVRDL